MEHWVIIKSLLLFDASTWLDRRLQFAEAEPWHELGKDRNSEDSLATAMVKVVAGCVRSPVPGGWGLALF